MLKRSIQTEKRKNLFIWYFKQVGVSFAFSIKGIADETIRHSYASLVLDRFLVLFLLQHHGLLDNNTRYLQDQLDMMHTAQADTFFSAFFLPLCHITFSGQTLSGQRHPSFGHIPTLAHPLFQKHPIEASYQPQIPDESFYVLFHLLDEYHWELIPRTYVGAANTDVGEVPFAPMGASPAPTISVGAVGEAPCGCAAIHHDIFADLLEQRIDQKQTGTYYTTDDVTDYVANNTILPALFYRLQKRYPAIMDPCSAIWQRLMHAPTRYIPAALQQPAYLPKETTQEYQLRQLRFTNLIVQLQQGMIRTMDVMVTHNLDILRFAVDVISTYQDLELLVTVFTELEQLTILDPTCGSGAFLCAALTTLQTLYMVCLKRMQEIVGRHSWTEAEDSLVRVDAILKRMSAAPNMSYFVVHHIIAHNLYGVDLMDEATRVCTLRLYLTLLAQTQRIEDVSPLHQIPIHIKTGNALVGDLYSIVFPEVTQLGGFAVILGNPPYIEYNKIRDQYAIDGYEEKSCGNIYAAMLERSLALLHPDGGYIGLLLPMSICGGQRFAQLRALLTRSLSPIWLANFDIFPCRLLGNAFQRLSILLGRHKAQPLRDHAGQGRHKAQPLRDHAGQGRHKARPLQKGRGKAQPLQTDIYTTRVHRWYIEERPFIIDLLRYTLCCQPTTHTPLQQLPVFPKIASTLHAEILQKIATRSHGHTIAMAQQDHKTSHFVYYQEATNYWVKAVCHIPFYKKNGTTMTPPHGRLLFFGDEQTARIIMALMNSSLFYLWFTTYSDGFHLAHSVVTSFPCDQELLEGDCGDGDKPHPLSYMASMLEADLLAHTRLSTRNTQLPGENRPQDRHAIELTEYQVSYSKALIDEIDRLLAHYYNFTEDELAFIVNYDKKYRMGQARDNTPK